MGKIVVVLIAGLFFTSHASADAHAENSANIPKTKLPERKDNPSFLASQGSTVPGKHCVAVIDSGLDYLHEDFRGAIFTNPNESEMSLSAKADGDNNGYTGDLHGWDFVDNDPFPFDYDQDILEYPLVKSFYEFYGHDLKKLSEKDRMYIRYEIEFNPFIQMMIPQSAGGHGTHVSGIVLKNNPSTCILPLRVDFSWQQVTAAVEYAAKMGVRVVNMSFGAVENKSSLEKQIQFEKLAETLEKHSDMLFVMVSHNQGKDLDAENLRMMPAALDIENKIVVGAIDDDGNLATFSNISEKMVDVYALGVNIKSAQAGGGTTKMSGTSMAAPMIAGLAVKILNEDPDKSVIDAKNIIFDMARVQELEHSSKKKFIARLLL